MTNPYRGLSRNHFWKRAVAEIDYQQIDPAQHPSFQIDPADLVAAAGSCFAQHIAREIRVRGYNYFDAEPPHPLISARIARAFSYGLFSARFGNIYTARQLLQLFLRAFSEFQPRTEFWQSENGRLVDALRPTVQKDGFHSPEDLRCDRDFHLACVRDMFKRANVFVFTLGLTEAWEEPADGTVFPVCPALFDPEFSESKYRFKNFRVSEVIADLQEFVDRLREVNPGVRILLTVSPVPLIATYEDAHVLTATTYSKSVLRTAAQEIVCSNKLIDYFPSYEIITGSHSRGRYFESDLRSVTSEGVAHVMRSFFNNYARGIRDDEIAIGDEKAQSRQYEKTLSDVNAVLCDEELLDKFDSLSAQGNSNAS